MKKLVCSLVFLCLIASVAWGNVKIDGNNFPDDIFRQYISENFDTDDDGELSNSEIATITKIKVLGKGISKLDGVKFFTSLEYLDCQNNGLTTLDLSNMSSLRVVYCSGNSIGNNLNLNGCANLTRLGCSYNEMSNFDFSEFTKLEYLRCSYNKFSEIDVSSNVALTTLRCSNNDLEALNLGTNIALMELDCAQNKIKTLDLSKNTALKNLYCASNSLTSLNINPNTALQKIECQNNALVSLVLPASEVFADDGVNLSPQNIGGLKINGTYYIDFLNDKYGLFASDMKSISNVKAYNTAGNEINLTASDNDNGVYTFAEAPVRLSYVYAADTTHNMTVTITAKPQITITTLEKGYVNRKYSAYLEASGSGKLTWAIKDEDKGKFPSGLTLSASTGKISGIPTETDIGKHQFTVTVTDTTNDESDEQLCTLEIASSSESPESVSITTINSDIPAGYANVKGYSYKFEATPAYGNTWSIDKAPDGLSFSSAGRLSGTPEKAGVFNVNVTVTDSKGGVDTQKFSITIKENSAYANRPNITTTQSDLSTAYVNNIYRQTFNAESTTTTRWSIVDGNIPGVSMRIGGSLYGSPTTVGTYPITVRAINTEGGFDDKSFTVTVQTSEQAPAKPTIITRTLANAYINRDYTAQLEANGTKPITWGIASGALPTEMTLNSSTGIISGKPTKADSYSITVQATNSAGDAQKTLSLIVRANSPEPEQEINNTNGDSGGGGGCNFADLGMGILALFGMFFVKKCRYSI